MISIVGTLHVSTPGKVSPDETICVIVTGCVMIAFHISAVTLTAVSKSSYTNFLILVLLLI